MGLGAAIEYIESVGLAEIANYESQLMSYLVDSLTQVNGIEIYGNDDNRMGVVAFNMKGLHSFDVGAFLDRYGVAIRTGHHCAMPLIKKLGQSSVCRASIGMYTQSSDIDALVQGLNRINQLLR